jgi:tRNA threonylcarbamoyladenosine biosynthesis protein TsaB
MNFLVFNTSPSQVEVALYQDATCLQTRTDSYKQSSAHLLRHLDDILAAERLSLTELSFIAANAGPGPCTTLRTVLALVNGLGYATRLPLVAVNGIEAFIREQYKPEYTHTFALLNAFCNDVFFAQHEHATDSITMGCYNITVWLEQLTTFLTAHPYARIQFIGNGYFLHQAVIAQVLGSNSINLEALPLSASTPAIAQMALKLWQQKKITAQIDALYFKAYMPHKA